MSTLKILFSPVLMATLLVMFGITMAAATFIENDYGPAAAYSIVYSAWWFELILALLAVNMTGQLFVYRLFRKEKLPVALFHLAFVLMIAGAAVTRYFGWEGSIQIREGDTQATCYSAGSYLGYKVTDQNGNLIEEDSRGYTMTSSTADQFREKFRINGNEYELVLARIIPNAIETITDTPDGEPLVSLFVTSDMMNRETILLRKGETRVVNGLSIGFVPVAPADINIISDSVSFYFVSRIETGQMSMGAHETLIARPGEKVPLKAMQIISVNNLKIVPQKLSFAAVSRPASADRNEQVSGMNAFVFHLFSGNRSETIYLWDKETEMQAGGSCNMDGISFEVTYGSKEEVLPFALRLDDFVLERYPGSNSPSGYKSQVTLIDETAGVEKPFSIYMNNILKYRGYRFYQSSYDRDEKGTVLSVNRDMAGMLITYTGYALLFLFIILSLISRDSAFRTLKAGQWQSPLRKIALIIVLIISASVVLNAQMLVPSRQIADEFGKVLIQDQGGRTEPLYTLSNDIVRKITRDNKFGEYSSMQVFSGIFFDFENWKDIQLIRINNRELQQQAGIIGNMASFSDLVDLAGQGSYKLSGLVNAAYEKTPAERNKFDKEVIKADERVNIVYMIYKGDFLRMFPLKDGTDKWGPSGEALEHHSSREDSLYLASVIPLLSEAFYNNNEAAVRQITESIGGYQERFSSYSLPSETKVKFEVLYYKLAVFERLFPFYLTAGLLMLIILIVGVIRGSDAGRSLIRIIFWILFAGFILHTAGLAIRWYVSGHSPMSNGYESMIFISWVTILAGFIFSRKSDFALSATSVLGGLTLLVAHMSFMDPQITNLVPVLKSYWLTLHVSVITASYGFLGLGAIIGIIIMVLLTLVNEKNMKRISDTIDGLTVINFRTLVLGLYFLTIGTFLGAIWANESWGRYWGWDPKETWSLITIIVYTLVTHSRMIPGLKSVYSFNLLSLCAFSSVLMTYFGVNYYLSGLHSYAGGDPVPVPAFVYIAVLALATLSVTAYIRYSKFKK
jgi:cytochrome c-type biogenesis protein CcsB